MQKTLKEILKMEEVEKTLKNDESEKISHKVMQKFTFGAFYEISFPILLFRTNKLGCFS
jgi:hypothetical protein